MINTPLTVLYNHHLKLINNKFYFIKLIEENY